MSTPRPITILIAALGGEGGGVLTQWIVSAAAQAGFPVQSTSIPGVAQRTGATTYYIEILPVPSRELGGRRGCKPREPRRRCLDEANEFAAQIIQRRQRRKRAYGIDAERGRPHGAAKDHELVVILGKSHCGLRRRDRVD